MAFSSLPASSQSIPEACSTLKEKVVNCINSEEFDCTIRAVEAFLFGPNLADAHGEGDALKDSKLVFKFQGDRAITYGVNNEEGKNELFCSNERPIVKGDYKKLGKFETSPAKLRENILNANLADFEEPFEWMCKIFGILDPVISNVLSCYPNLEVVYPFVRTALISSSMASQVAIEDSKKNV